MFRILLSVCAALAGCTRVPEDAAMRSIDPRQSHSATDDRGQAAQGPIPALVSATGELAPGSLPNSSAAAQGRTILSTAFVRLGPDGRLTVELHDGRTLILRDVTMGPAKYCGMDVAAGSSGARYCGSYAEVAAARPGAMPVAQHDPAAVQSAARGGEPPRHP